MVLPVNSCFRENSYLDSPAKIVNQDLCTTFSLSDREIKPMVQSASVLSVVGAALISLGVFVPVLAHSALVIGVLAAAIGIMNLVALCIRNLIQICSSSNSQEIRQIPQASVLAQSEDKIETRAVEIPLQSQSLRPGFTENLKQEQIIDYAYQFSSLIDSVKKVHDQEGRALVEIDQWLSLSQSHSRVFELGCDLEKVRLALEFCISDLEMKIASDPQTRTLQHLIEEGREWLGNGLPQNDKNYEKMVSALEAVRDQFVKGLSQQNLDRLSEMLERRENKLKEHVFKPVRDDHSLSTADNDQQRIRGSSSEEGMSDGGGGSPRGHD